MEMEPTHKVNDSSIEVEGHMVPFKAHFPEEGHSLIRLSYHVRQSLKPFSVILSVMTMVSVVVVTWSVTEAAVGFVSRLHALIVSVILTFINVPAMITSDKRQTRLPLITPRIITLFLYAQEGPSWVDIKWLHHVTNKNTPTPNGD